MEAFLGRCDYSFDAITSIASGVCPGKDSCSCAISVFDSPVCGIELIRIHDSNVPASSRFDGTDNIPAGELVPAIPADGVFLYSLKYNVTDEAARATLLSEEWEDSMALAIQLYLSMEDANVTVASRYEEEETMTVVLSVQVPPTSIAPDLINVNRLLYSAKANEIFPSVLDDEHVDGTRLIGQESGVDVARNAMAKTNANTPGVSNRVPIFAALGGIVGCIIGATAVYALKKRRSWGGPSMSISNSDTAAPPIQSARMDLMNPYYKNIRSDRGPRSLPARR